MTGKEKGMPAVERSRAPEEGVDRMIETFVYEKDRIEITAKDEYELVVVNATNSLPITFSGHLEAESNVEHRGLTYGVKIYRCQPADERMLPRYIKVEEMGGEELVEDDGQKHPTCKTCEEEALGIIKVDGDMFILQCRNCLAIHRMTWVEMGGPKSRGVSVDNISWNLLSNKEALINSLVPPAYAETRVEQSKTGELKTILKKDHLYREKLKEAAKELIDGYGVDPMQIMRTEIKDEADDKE